MKEVFVPWDAVPIPRLHTESIIRKEDMPMPTEEEVEQLVTAIIDRQQELERAIRETIDKSDKGGDKE